MKENQEALNQIALTLAHHFDSLYYVDIKSGKYYEYMPNTLFEGLNIPSHGEDFFTESQQNAPKCVHPDDLELVIKLHNKEAMLSRLSKDKSYSAVYRLILNGNIIHMRHFEIMCEDQMHIICCLENIEEEFRKKEEQERDLQSARRMARMDALTGIRNKNAFNEYAAAINAKIDFVSENYHFAVIMCDVNDLKKINDTRGHSFGDEAIQRTSRLICDIFDHSPVFRVGGDEFVVVLDGRDYDMREQLLAKLREESVANKLSRSGPVVACGMAVYNRNTDDSFNSVYQRADKQMYKHKNELKSTKIVDYFMGMNSMDVPITAERKRLLDSLFGALYTVIGEGYVYLNDLKHDFSRWSLPLVDDFGMQSEYMYHADKCWQEHIHPDDMKIYREAIDAVLCGNAEVRPILYRARRTDGTYAVCHTRGFVLSDKDGNPEYFGGIIVTE